MAQKTTSESPVVPLRTRRRVGWLLIAYYVSILLINLWTLLAGDERVIRSQVLEFLAFVLTAAMIVVARGSLQTFRIDRISLLAFLIFGTALRVSREPGDAFELGLTYLAFTPVALVVVLALFRSRAHSKSLAPFQWKWLFGGLLVGAALGLAVLRVSSLIYGRSSLPQPISAVTAPSVALTFLYVMGHTAILEEPVSRGFLWGFMEHRRWKPSRIWVFQAAVFWLIHLRHLDSPFTFWIALPLGGLMLGWLSWKSGSVAAALTAHAAYNTFGAYF